jgi:NAD(P)H dehydrogenase (quinone)
MADPVNVLVVFYSRYGTAERLALAAGLGAIQEEANIRLRRLPDRADASAIAADAEWSAELARMQRDYVAPRPADPVWAELIILAAPARSDGEVEGYVASLPACGPMAGKLAGPLAAGNDAGVLRGVYASAACAGLVVAPSAIEGDDAIAGARLHGRALVRAARALRAASAPA